MRKLGRISMVIFFLFIMTISLGAQPKKDICPVMGEEINPQYAVKYEYKGNTYVFCCESCVAKFKENPAQYIGKAQQPLSGEAKKGIREIKVTAKKFEFLPDPIGVKQGEKVRLIISTLDVTHGLGIKEYKINRTIEKGKTEVIEFTADKAGSFVMSCTVYCGDGHSVMKGKLIVHSVKPNVPAMDEHHNHKH